MGCHIHPSMAWQLREKVYIVIAGEAEEANEHAQLVGAMLGVGYDIKADKIYVSFSPTYHIKGKGSSKTPVHLSHQDIAQLREGQGRFSLRSAASYVMGHYDPLGLTSPISLRTKLIRRKFYVA